VKGRLFAAFAAVYFIWGSTYLAIRIVLRTLPPFLTAGVRFLVAGGLLYVVSRAQGAPRPSRSEWLAALILGGLMLLVGNGAVMWAELRIPSGPAALLVATEPVLVVLFQRRRPSLLLLLGLLLGMGGMAILIGPAALGGGEPLDPLAALAILGGCAGWAAGSLYARTAAAPRNELMSAGTRMLAGGALLCVLGLAHGDVAATHLAAVSSESLLALLYLCVFGSIVAFTAYGYMMRNAAPSLVATYAFVNPVVAVILGALIGHELLTTRVIAAALTIVAGVVLITKEAK
jgi:drug/metabolite transporter (DMT)-like permease